MRRAVEQENFRDRFGFGLGPLEDLVIELQLIDGVDQVVLLVADVDAVKHGQQIALDHVVARAKFAKDRRAFGGRFWRVGDLADLNHLGRRWRGREPRPNAVDAGRVEQRRAGHREGPRPLRLFGDGDPVNIVLADAQRHAHVFGHQQCVRRVVDELDGGGRRVGMLRDGLSLGGFAKVQGAVGGSQADNDHNCENGTTNDFGLFGNEETHRGLLSDRCRSLADVLVGQSRDSEVVQAGFRSSELLQVVFSGGLVQVLVQRGDSAASQTWFGKRRAT